MKRVVLVLTACACTTKTVTPVELAAPVVLPVTPITTHDAPHARSPIADVATFTSSRGVVRLVKDGTAIAGAYPNGVLTCKSNDAIVSCEWFESSSTGHATFHRARDGRFEGTYGNAASDDDLGEWTLTPIPESNDGISGAWDTNWGLATVRETRTGVHVDYPDGQMDCTREASALTCAWSEGSSTGSAELVIESARVWRGAWWMNGNAAQRSPWVFVRH